MDIFVWPRLLKLRRHCFGVQYDSHSVTSTNIGLDTISLNVQVMMMLMIMMVIFITIIMVLIAAAVIMVKNNDYFREDRAASGHNITDMLLECLFNGMACYARSVYLICSFNYMKLTWTFFIVCRQRIQILWVLTCSDFEHGHEPSYVTFSNRNCLPGGGPIAVW